MGITSSYLTCALDPDKRKIILDWLAKWVREIDADAIAFRGVSGALVAPCVADRTGKSLLVVRKPSSEEDRHSSLRVEGEMDIHSYVIIDDLVSTGQTLNAIAGDIAEACRAKKRRQPKLRGVILYRESYPSGVTIRYLNHPDIVAVCGYLEYDGTITETSTCESSVT
jgi:orotate phosphoribosyltransferase